MSIYKDAAIGIGDVELTPVAAVEMRAALSQADLPDDQKMWFERAEHDARCVYFGIRRAHELIGQIFLHDLEVARREAMVGYHVFQPSRRGRGYGSAALTAICSYAFGALRLRRLVAITSLDNAASRRIAEKCGFRELGAAREGPHLIVYERTSSITTS